MVVAKFPAIGENGVRHRVGRTPKKAAAQWKAGERI
jgi:hypothetical protein